MNEELKDARNYLVGVCLIYIVTALALVLMVGE